MKATTIVLILGFIALLGILSVSAAGQGGNGKMLQTWANPQDGTGYQYGGAVYQNSGNQIGQQSGNGTCIREDCPNNGTPLRDGTGLQYSRSGNGCGNGGHGCRHQSRT